MLTDDPGILVPAHPPECWRCCVETFINCEMLSEIMKYYDNDGREPPPQIYDSDSLTIKSQQLSVWCVKAVEPSQAAPVQSKQLDEHWASRITLTLSTEPMQVQRSSLHCI